MTGPDLDVIGRLATEIEATLRTLPGTKSVLAERVSEGSYIDVRYDLGRLADEGVTLSEATYTVRYALGGENAALIEQPDGTTVPLSVQYSPEYVDTLDKVRSFEPHLILLDIMMPKLSGFEVCQRIKSDAATSRIMVLMVTTLNELGDIERAVDAGCDDFLSKPVNKVELLKRVENMLRLKDTTDELERLRRYIEEMDERSSPRVGP